MLVLELMLIAVAYVSFTLFAQRKFSNYKRIKEIKVEMDAKMKEFKQMGKDVSQELLLLKQKEITALASEQMRHQLRSTLIVLPVSALLFYVLLPMAFPTAPNITLFTFTLSYRTFFIVVSFILGLISAGIVAMYEKSVARKPKIVPAQ